jgi:hypothetical protein
MSEEKSTKDGPAVPEQPGLVHPVDLVITIIILSVCGALYYVTTSFEEVSDMLSQNIPPEFFPRLVMLLIAILALALPFEHLFQRRRGNDLDSKRRKKLRPLVGRAAAETDRALRGAVPDRSHLGVQPHSGGLLRTRNLRDHALADRESWNRSLRA